MTAILDKIRQLDAARKRGDISEAEYNLARARVLATVEDADVVETPRPQRAAVHGAQATGAPSARPRAARTATAAPAATPPGARSGATSRAPAKASSPRAAQNRIGPDRGQVAATSSGAETTAAEEGSLIWGIVLIGLAASALLTFLLGRLIGDITIALTLAVTVFAAIVIAAFQRMQG